VFHYTDLFKIYLFIFCKFFGFIFIFWPVLTLHCAVLLKNIKVKNHYSRLYLNTEGHIDSILCDFTVNNSAPLLIASGLIANVTNIPADVMFFDFCYPNRARQRALSHVDLGLVTTEAKSDSCFCYAAFLFALTVDYNTTYKLREISDTFYTP
jgi:hypothetical protein